MARPVLVRSMSPSSCCCCCHACRDDAGLIGACIRHVKGQVGLDLSDAGNWWRFCDVHFDRCTSSEGVPKSMESAAKAGDHIDPSAKLFREVTVVFVVDISPLMPSKKALKSEVEENKVRKSLGMWLLLGDGRIEGGGHAFTSGDRCLGWCLGAGLRRGGDQEGQ